MQALSCMPRTLPASALSLSHICVQATEVAHHVKAAWNHPDYRETTQRAATDTAVILARPILVMCYFYIELILHLFKANLSVLQKHP